MADAASTGATTAPSIDVQRFDKWIGSNYYSGGWTGGGCQYCPCYVRGEYLAWWFTGDHLPPLVTTSPVGTPANEAGVLGQPGTSVIFGDQPTNGGVKMGARITLGAWIAPSARFELEWFGLGGNNTSFSANTDSTPIIATPHFDLSNGTQTAYLLGYPGVASASITAQETSFFNGAGAHLMRDSFSNRTEGGGLFRFGGLVGFRYLGLYEKLTMNSFTDLTGGATTADAFRTTNSFYGGNFGLYAWNQRGRWNWETIGRLGLGTTSEHATISGSSSGLSQAGGAGLFAVPSNIGSYVHDVFAVVPQLELKLAYSITPRWTARVGYDLLFWNRVARPGEQINPAFNPVQLSGVAVPSTFRFQESGLLIQGVSCGVELRY